MTGDWKMPKWMYPYLDQLPSMGGGMCDTEKSIQKQVAGLEEQMNKIIPFLQEEFCEERCGKEPADEAFIENRSVRLGDLMLAERVQSKIQLLEMLRERKLLRKMKKVEPA